MGKSGNVLTGISSRFRHNILIVRFLFTFILNYKKC